MKYILNPIYKLCQDKNRILLLSDSDDGGYVGYTHPVYAILLAQFTGEHEKSEAIQIISKKFNSSIENIEKIIKPLLSNKSVVRIKYDNRIFSFPPFLLIPNRKNFVRTDLDVSAFYIKPPYDFETKRLNTPKHAMLVLNTQCYTNCIYCYADKDHKYKPMSTERIIELIKEAKDIGMTNFELSGGEVLLHKDYDLIIKALLDNGFNPFISTKVPISIGKIDRLWEIGIRQIQISLESINPILQKENLGVKKDYVPLIIKTIKDLDEKGFDIIIKSTCTKETCIEDNLVELLKYIETINHLARYTFTPLGYSHYKSLDWYNEHKPSIKLIKKAMDIIQKHKKGKYEIYWDIDSIHHYEEYKNKASFNDRALCTGNVSGFIILPDGKVTICEELYWSKNFILGDLNKESIEEMWNSNKAYSLWKINRDIIPEDSACKTCETFEQCRYRLGICWKEVIAFFGKDNWLYPDPRCPKSPELNSTNKKLMYEEV